MADEIQATEPAPPMQLSEPPPHRYRTVTILAVLFVSFVVVGYFAWGASVRSSSELALKRAAQALLKGDPAAARDNLKWLLWFEPQNSAALHLAGMSCLRQNDLPAAKEHLERIREDSLVHENAQTLLASALLADQQFENAGDVLRRILRKYPKSAIACRQLSGLWLTELRSREAVQVLEEFLQRSLAEPIVLSDLLLLLRDLGAAEFHAPTPQDCLKTLQAALERHPDQFRVQLALAQCYVRLGKMEEAEQPLQEARRLNSQEFEYRLVDCEFWLAQGNADRANAALLGSNKDSEQGGSAGTIPESDDRAWELRCRIAELRGDDEHALADLDRARALRPLTKEHETRRARLLQKLQRTEEARQAYDRSHDVAKSELELWRLTRDLGVRTPTLAECAQVAGLYESLGKTLEAEAWRRLSELLARDTPAK